MTAQAPVTISVIFLHGLLTGVQAKKHRIDDLLTDAGVSIELLSNKSARVTATQYAAVFRLLIERFGDECLCFLSRPLKRGSFALMARSALTAKTMEAAIRRVAHTFHLLQDDIVAEVHHDLGRACLRFRFLNAQLAQSGFIHELLLRVFWRLIAWLAGGRLPVKRFDFAFQSPPYVGSYGRIFPAEMVFEQPLTAFWFDASWLHLPIRRDEAALRAFLAEAQLHILVPSRTDQVTSARVREHLQRSQTVWPDLAATAQTLHLSTATLQRKLASEGTSFQALKDDLRRDIAIMRLNTSAITLSELAQDLGFTDSAAFQRAFKSWTGSAPGAYRRGKAL